MRRKPVAGVTPVPAERLPAVGPAPVPDPDLESRLLWIWGSPRSGSTWMLQLLSHPLEPDPEAELGFKLPPGGAAAVGRPIDSIPVDESFISNHFSPALADPRLVDGRWVPGTINNLMAPKPAYAFSDSFADAWRPAARDFALARLTAFIDRARAEGLDVDPACRIVIKETNGSHAADVVMGSLQRSRMLLLIRDGRDVVDSLLAAYKPNAFMANKLEYSFSTDDERAAGLLWAARLWACNTDMTLKAMEQHDPELTRVVRYEDLLTDGVTELKGIYDWLGLQREPGFVDDVIDARAFTKISEKQRGPLTRNRSAKPGLWRENLSRKEQAKVHEICGPLLERFGYDV